MLRALIIDDELAAAKSLELLIDKYVDGVEVVGIAYSVAEAIQKVEMISPDIVFLDIEMPGGNGFQFLEQCPTRAFEVVFTTAYQAYALKAIKYSAVDYLLKPIGVDELRNVSERVAFMRQTKFDSRKKYYALFENIKTLLPLKLVVTVQNTSEFIDLSEVAYFEMSPAGTTVYKSNGASMCIDNKLGDLMEILDKKNFFKINAQQAVNTAMVKRVGKTSVDLSNGVSLQILPMLRKEMVEYVERLLQ